MWPGRGRIGEGAAGYFLTWGVFSLGRAKIPWHFGRVVMGWALLLPFPWFCHQRRHRQCVAAARRIGCHCGAFVAPLLLLCSLEQLLNWDLSNTHSDWKGPSPSIQVPQGKNLTPTCSLFPEDTSPQLCAAAATEEPSCCCLRFFTTL